MLLYVLEPLSRIVFASIIDFNGLSSLFFFLKLGSAGIRSIFLIGWANLLVSIIDEEATEWLELELCSSISTSLINSIGLVSTYFFGGAAIYSDFSLLNLDLVDNMLSCCSLSISFNCARIIFSKAAYYALSLMRSLPKILNSLSVPLSFFFS